MQLQSDALSASPPEQLLPLPPPELRRLVCHDDSLFDLLPNGPLIFPYLTDPKQYRSVFDFGCGCGRIARQLLVQNPQPQRYVGIDIHAGMVDWCSQNLSPVNPAFQFHHHDVWNLGLGSHNTRQSTASFPASAGEFSLVVAHSVFTHLYKEQTEYYLSEIARILTGDGIARTTWFLFDRLTFPMMFDFQVTLFINETDPTNAVIYEWRWLLDTLRSHGLRLVHAVPPTLRGHQWELYLRKCDGSENAPFALPAHLMMCGSGVSTASPPDTLDTAIATPGNPPLQEQPPPASPEPPPPSVSIPPASGPRHLLRFTGTATETDFSVRCAGLQWWYHSYYFENGFSVRGDYDIGADIADYGFPDSMKGMRVLDIGTGAGWFAHYFEQQGAEVFTVDARGYSDFDVYGRAEYPPIESENRLPDIIDNEGQPAYFSPVSQGFWVMKDLLKSKVRFRNSRIYDIHLDMFEGQKFDLVFIGALLCHLRDPIGALMAAKRVCRHRIIASTPVVLGETAPDILPRQYLPYTEVDKISWWLPNEACFKHWFLAAGLTGVDISRQVSLRADLHRTAAGAAGNGDQLLRVGSAFVP